MRSATLNLLLLLTALITSTSATLGINCRGSNMCQKSQNSGLDPNNDLIDEFYQALANGASAYVTGGPIDPSAIWYYGQDVACYNKGGICLYLEATVSRGMVGVNGSVIIDRVGDLNNHHCWYCGSVPLSGDNNPNEMGVLVSNYVTQTTCTGVCPNTNT
ncbi:hypothetical protein MMC08_007980 [Hypocenomyce scalaris]|nr:hypothetical protein [Hypocenomyce scalaris]